MLTANGTGYFQSRIQVLIEHLYVQIPVITITYPFFTQMMEDGAEQKFQ